MASESVALYGFECSLAGRRLSVRGGDPELAAELATVVGQSAGPAEAGVEVVLEDHGPEALDVRFVGDPGAENGVDELLLGLSSPGFPFHLLPAPPGEVQLAFEESDQPLFVFRGGECRVHKRPLWRRALSFLIFHRLLRTRRDAIFFHAASLEVAGRGVMLVGPKGAGKSTTALALAARGHSLLGDETAGYVPEAALLLPMRRPVGIKPGPRATAVSLALEELGTTPERDGILRLDVDRLFRLPEAAPAPLAAVFFLTGFEAEPRVEEIEPGRDDVAQLQPFACSLVNATALQRVFQMSRMLSRARTFRLWPGRPEPTAEAVERLVTAWA